MLSMRNGDHLHERLWAYDDYTEFDDRPAESSGGLASLGFIRAVLRRRKWAWRIMAVLGMVIGFGIAARLPVVYQASTSLLVTPMSTGGEDSGAPITNEQAIADSRTVAQLALNQLGLRESVDTFLASYTVTDPTDRVLVITVSAPSPSDAVSRANAVATQYLQFRAKLIDAEQNLMTSSLDQQLSQDKQNLNSINAQISQVSAQPSTPSQQTELASLGKQKTQATDALTELEDAAVTSQATSQVTTDTLIQDSRQLDPAAAAPPHSRMKRVLEYTALGLVAGLALGMGIVVIGALLSDKLRQRDDVAHALRAPVKLSVGIVRGRRIGLEAAAENASIQRIVAYLGKAVPARRQGPASLAVVPVDDLNVPAACLVSLAISRAKQGLNVVVADLSDGTPAARLLDADEPGVRTVNVDGTQLTVAVPEPDDVMPAGPLPGGPGQAQAAEPLVTACASADLLLTLAVLDPSLGGEHLAGWARAAVVTVTAGQSSAARIQATAEMIRLSGTSLISGVLIGADKTDESLGLRVTPDADHADSADHADRVAVVPDGLGSPAKGFIAVDEGPRRG
jgi:capsular polysaccharide biosynthesis protein